jgi:hypothetical protein
MEPAAKAPTVVISVPTSLEAAIEPANMALVTEAVSPVETRVPESFGKF